MPPPQSEPVHGTERSTFTALFKALYPDLRWYVQGLTREAGAAEDVVQEAFTRLWERRAAIDPGRSVRAYLYATARNLALNHLRNTATRKTLLDTMDPAPDLPGPEEALRTAQMQQQLRAWIDELPARRREAFELSRFCDLSHAEVAQVMGLTTHTVEKHITDALRHLRDRLRTLDPDFLNS